LADVASVSDRRAGLPQYAADARDLAAELRAMREQGAAYGRRHRARALPSMSNMSPPTRPGRCTWAIAAARWWATRWRRLLEYAGHKVTREYYINDAGGQVDVLARSVHLRYREALGEDVGEIPEGFIPATIWCRSGRQAGH
jgi:arginyl-tRNA synthetase